MVPVQPCYIQLHLELIVENICGAKIKNAYRSSIGRIQSTAVGANGVPGANVREVAVPGSRSLKGNVITRNQRTVENFASVKDADIKFATLSLVPKELPLFVQSSAPIMMEKNTKEKITLGCLTLIKPNHVNFTALT